MHGNSFANGPVAPKWARDEQFKALQETRITWEKMP
jgi:hypothetical protein